MSTLRKLYLAAFVVVLLGSIATPAKAQQTYTECVDYWLDRCNAALEDSNWIQKPIIGASCTVVIAGCAVTNI